MPTPPVGTKWGILWVSGNKLDGHTERFMWDRYPNRASVPLVFKTREEARAYIRLNYGYIRFRLDLRREPHGWKTPVPVKVVIEVRKV